MSKLSKLSDRITFGKHKGKTVEQLLSESPSYLVWLIEKTERTDFPNQIINKIYMEDADINMAKSFENFVDAVYNRNPKHDD